MNQALAAKSGIGGDKEVEQNQALASTKRDLEELGRGERERNNALMSEAQRDVKLAQLNKHS